MLKEVMGQAGLSTYSIVAMLVALAAAVGVVVYLFVLRRKEHFHKATRLPLDDGQLAGGSESSEVPGTPERRRS
jgi:cbb3-type cytochrome oxidase subunit 3